MVVLTNRAKMTTATTGTGTITLGAALSGYQSFADSGVANADVVRYGIEDGAAWEIGTGTYTTTGTTLSRTPIESSNADAAISLSGAAVVFVTTAAADIVQPTATQTLTNKTITDLVLDGQVTEQVFAVTGTTPALDAANGTVQTWTLSGASTPTSNLATGESLTLMIDDGTANTITWPTMQWAGGAAPTLATTGYTGVVLFNVAGTLYGSLIGDFS
jgi:hypothetical protein